MTLCQPHHFESFDM